jgi:hypothetical protein
LTFSGREQKRAALLPVDALWIEWNSQSINISSEKSLYVADLPATYDLAQFVNSHLNSTFPGCPTVTGHACDSSCPLNLHSKGPTQRNVRHQLSYNSSPTRAAQQRGAQEEQGKIQQTQAQTQNLQSEAAKNQAMIPWFAARKNAQQAIATQRGQLSTKQLLDMATEKAYDNGENPELNPDVIQLRQTYAAEQAAGNTGKDGAPKPTQQAIWDQRKQEAGQLGLDAGETKFYIANGKLREGNPDLTYRKNKNAFQLNA